MQGTLRARGARHAAQARPPTAWHGRAKACAPARQRSTPHQPSKARHLGATRDHRRAAGMTEHTPDPGGEGTLTSPYPRLPTRSRRAEPNAAAQPPGSRKMLPPSSPLRTGHERFPSSGSSPWPLSPVLLVVLPMAPGVYNAFVLDIVCSTLACRDNMIRFYAFSCYERDSTQSASVSLLLVQYQPLFRVGFPSHLVLLPLCPVLA